MKSSIGLPAALSIGIGGMIGAGIFSILGVVAGISGSALPISFAIGGVVAGLAAYSYVALGKAFPTVGGSVTFLVRGYGEGVLSGSLSLFQYFSFIITIALYATGFAAYAGTFISLPSKVWAVGVVLAFTLINFLGTRTMGRAESIIVIIKLTILVIFIVAAFVALPGRGLDRLSPATWPGPLAVLSGAAVLFVGYEGFGLITNAAANMAPAHPRIAPRNLRQCGNGDRDLHSCRHRRGDQRASRCPQGSWRLCPGRCRQAVTWGNRFQIGRHRGVAGDRVSSERHAVRLCERRLPDRQER